MAIVAGVIGLLYDSLVGTAPQKRPDPTAIVRDKLVKFPMGFNEFTDEHPMRRDRLDHEIAPPALRLRPGCSALSAMAAGAARAAEDETRSITKILRGIIEGLGLKTDGEAIINYQERAPLVIPPSRDLPPPESRCRRSPIIRPGRRIRTSAAPQGAARQEKNRNISDETRARPASAAA